MSLHPRENLKSYTVCLFYGAEQGCFGGCGLFNGGNDKTGTPYQATVSSKAFQEMSNYIKETDKNSLYFNVDQS